MAGVDLKTVQELMGSTTIAVTARHADLAPTHELQALETQVREGSISVPSGYKMATRANRSHTATKRSTIQLVETK